MRRPRSGSGSSTEGSRSTRCSRCGSSRSASDCPIAGPSTTGGSRRREGSRTDGGTRCDTRCDGSRDRGGSGEVDSESDPISGAQRNQSTRAGCAHLCTNVGMRTWVNRCRRACQLSALASDGQREPAPAIPICSKAELCPLFGNEFPTPWRNMKLSCYEEPGARQGLGSLEPRTRLRPYG